MIPHNLATTNDGRDYGFNEYLTPLVCPRCHSPVSAEISWIDGPIPFDNVTIEGDAIRAFCKACHWEQRPKTPQMSTIETVRRALLWVGPKS